MAAIHFHNCDTRNQFVMGPEELYWKSRNYRFAKLRSNEAETLYQYTDFIGNTHTIIVSNWDIEARETIEGGQNYLQIAGSEYQPMS
jgi:hypothetical protein